MGNAFKGYGGLGRNRDGLAGFLLLPTWRERFDVGNQISLLLGIKGVPDRHVRIREPTADRVEQILVNGQGTGWSRTTFENRGRKIAGLGIDPHGIFPIPVTQVAVTAGAVAAVIVGCAGGVRMTRNVANVALHFGPGNGWMGPDIRHILGGDREDRQRSQSEAPESDAKLVLVCVLHSPCPRSLEVEIKADQKAV